MNQKSINANASEFKQVIHLDEKILAPKDNVRSDPTIGSKTSEASPRNLRPQGLQKSLIGKPRVYDTHGNLLAEEDNLVVLKGREYLAQLITGRSPLGAGSCPNETPINNMATPCDYKRFKLTHFAVGNQGTDGNCPPVTSGPYDNDINLNNPKELYPQSGYQSGIDYLHMDINRRNTLKRIEFDGNFEVVSEEHTINLEGNGQEVVQAFTAIRYRMYLNPGESTDDPGSPYSVPFRFNEAGLYAVEYQDDGQGGEIPVIDQDGAANYILFARFTTLDKYLEEADGIMIEWYVLV